MARCYEKRKLAAQREFMYGSSTDPGSISSFHRTSALSLHPGPPRSTKNTSARTSSPSRRTRSCHSRWRRSNASNVAM